MEFFMLLAGLMGLWLGTEATLRGAVAVAGRLGVSEFIVGIVVLSIGSDLPELAIAIDAAIKNLHSGEASDVVVGSALGSDLGQIGFVLGVTALIGILTLPRKVVYQQGSVLLGSLVLLAVVGLDGHVSRLEGALLLAVYAAYLAFFLTGAIRPHSTNQGELTSSIVLPVIYLIAGVAVIVGSAEITVASAIQVAAMFEVEQSAVAILFIGLGSSLPELSISLGAILKGRPGLSAGNLIGSNVFDTLVPIGVAAMISGLQFDPGMLRHEMPFLFCLTLLVLMFLTRRTGIRKSEAGFILGAYISYVIVKLAYV
jgi:cation:H+ antiporter